MFRPISKDWRISVDNAGLALRNRRVRRALLILGAGYIAYAFVLFPTTTARVRLGMDLTVGGVTRSASNIVELRSRAGFGLAGLRDPSLPTIRGEAVLLTLGQRATLVMLIAPVAATPPDWPIRQMIAAAGGDPNGSLDAGISHVAATSRRFEFSQGTAEFRGELRSLHPDVIFLADRRTFTADASEEQAWRPVPLDAPDPILGTAGAQISLWIEPVSSMSPISRGDLGARLPFFNGFWARHHLAEPAPPALRPSNFKID